MNARKSKFFRRIARAMTTVKNPKYDYKMDAEGTITCFPGTFKAQYRALKKAPNALAILKAAVAK